MNARLAMLARRRATLVARSVAQRQALAAVLAPLRAHAARAGRVAATVQDTLTNPLTWAAAAIVLVILRPAGLRRAARWGWRAWQAWRWVGPALRTLAPQRGR